MNDDSRIVRVPDIGDFDEVDVIEVHVAEGDEIAAEDPIVTLETDKASMDLPAPRGGRVESVLVKAGDKVAEGSELLRLAATAEASADDASAAPSGGEGAGAGGERTG